MSGCSLGESNKRYQPNGNANPLGNTSSDGSVIGNVSGLNAGFSHFFILDRFT
jgi:hypothetical protein